MREELMPAEGPHPGFERGKYVDEQGTEYWLARELMTLFGYVEWRSFEEVLKRAEKAALNSGQDIHNHFVRLTKMVPVGSGAMREVVDYQLDRYACYLIAQNGDSAKTEIALAQTYFTVQTRKQELIEKLPEDEKRLFIRGEVSEENKKLFRTARQAGVSNFGVFNDAGYRGLYGAPLYEVERRKGIAKGELLDRAGSTELAANLFRITQTDEKLRKDGTRSEIEAARTHNMIGGKVRQTIKDIGGVLPENLRTERHIKEVKKDVKALAKRMSAKLLKPKKTGN